MNLGTFIKFLELLGYPANGAGLGGGGVAGVKPVGTLSKSGAAVPVTASTAEVVVATIAVPANALIAPGACLRGFFDTTQTLTSTKTLRARLGGVIVWSYVLPANNPVNSFVFQIRATAAAAQTTANPASTSGAGIIGGASSGVVNNTTVDMTQAQNLTISIQNASASDTTTYLGHTTELLA